MFPRLLLSADSLHSEPSFCGPAALSTIMEEHDDSDIIEHHVEEEMEKTGAFMESPSGEREGFCSTQSSHRLLAYSDALISIIATVMVRLNVSDIKWFRL